MRYQRFGGVLFLCLAMVCGAAAPTDVRAQGETWTAQFPRLAALAGSGVKVSALVEELDSGRPLAAVDAASRLIPASVSKLYVARAALEVLGADHRFITRLLASGAVEGTELRGDLMLRAGGDPTLSSKDLRALVADISALGITRITGNLIVEDALFGAIACEIKDRCDAHKESAHAFDGALSAAGIDYGTVEVVIYPAQRAGQPARVVVMPPGVGGFRLHGHIETVSAGGLTRLGITRSTDDEGLHHLHLSGEIAVDHRPVRRSRSIVHPAHHTAEVLRALLDQGGIRVEGETRVTHKAATLDKTQELARHYGETLATQLHAMMQYSNNYIADLLTLHVAQRDAAPERLSDAADHLLLPLRAASQSATDTPPGMPILHSGSGLSVDSRLSARDLVELLRDSYEASALFPTFVGTLPVPLYSRNSQLAFDDNNWQTRLAAKTGWLSEPVGVRALAGYLRLQDGGWAAFAIILNGTPESPRLPREKTLGAIRADMRDLLARH
ncbi:D-alanyl-D-alanine carboxypeptidase/D-alanyl-D-alanine endopeptidase [Algiphilus sp.]|uniref:D-alanyl-D-alanine carboxypeptidase/D-alanyl-D-alanine endopeptidase n=1 Tax=Algiphilus sp. TaxID=1872431 RepID=UPI003B517589